MYELEKKEVYTEEDYAEFENYGDDCYFIVDVVAKSKDDTTTGYHIFQEEEDDLYQCVKTSIQYKMDKSQLLPVVAKVEIIDCGIHEDIHEFCNHLMAEHKDFTEAMKLDAMRQYNFMKGTFADIGSR